MNLLNLLKRSFRLEPHVVFPINKMLICGITTIFPLVLGHLLGQLEISILGSLLGMALTLNDHQGKLKDRLPHLTIVSICLIFSYFIGILVSHSKFYLLSIVFIATFLLGKNKSRNLELERILLFSSLNIVTVAGLSLDFSHVESGAVYALFNFILYILLVLIGAKLNQGSAYTYAKKIKMLKANLKNLDNNFFSITLSLFVLLSYLISSFLKLDRSYWVVGTVIIVMIPDREGTYLRAIQRFIGTILGIIVALIFLPMFKFTILIPIALIFFSCFLMPYAIGRNFMLGNIFISTYVFILIELSRPSTLSSTNLAWLRIIDILIGGLIGILGIAIYIKLPYNNGDTKK